MTFVYLPKSSKINWCIYSLSLLNGDFLLKRFVSQLPTKIIAYNTTVLKVWLSHCCLCFCIQDLRKVWEDIFIHEIGSWKKNELVIILFSIQVKAIKAYSLCFICKVRMILLILVFITLDAMISAAVWIL